jgi:hypothetical protein
MAVRTGWLENFLKPDSERGERRSAKRRPVERFAAYRWTGSNLKEEAVRDISSTGIYLLTEKRWPIGTMVFLTLQREGPLEMNPERRIEVHTKVVRHGEDGVGVAFVLEESPESLHWKSLRERLIEQAKPKDMQGLVRVAEAVVFLSRLCPGGSEEVEQLLCGRLSNHKVANAIEIVLKTEDLVSFEPPAHGLRADRNLVLRILEYGSCTDEDWLQHFWAGILATSCAADGKGEPSPVFVELFSKLTTFPVRILTVVCTRATKFLTESGSIAAKPLAYKIEELTLTTGSRGLQIGRDLEILSQLGLIEIQTNSRSLLASEEANITPTSLGLELFARCHGHRGSLRDFYRIDFRDGLG